MPLYGKRKAEYTTYIQSEEWAAKRRAFWAQHKRACARCGSKAKLHVHHMTYDNFKKEYMSDLTGLCENCHNLVHDTHRKVGGDLREVTLSVVARQELARIPTGRRNRKKVKKEQFSLAVAMTPTDRGFVPKHLRGAVMGKRVVSTTPWNRNSWK